VEGHRLVDFGNGNKSEKTEVASYVCVGGAEEELDEVSRKLE
jgi:hypothetical protein